MYIVSLAVRDLRVIEELQISPGPGINFIVGGNGAGKTSVLEAIYLAGRGRTFRHKEAGPMIREGAESVTLMLRIGRRDRERLSTLGLRREKSSLTCRLDGQDVRKRSVLAETLPVQWIGSQPQLFLSLGPEVRRRFVDMGLFHVEQSYLGLMEDFQRVLRQRNAAIRSGDRKAVVIWNKPFQVTARRVNERREHFVLGLTQRVARKYAYWPNEHSPGFRFKPGWNTSQELTRQLQESLDVDMRLGYTTRGPHRADLDILANGTVAEKALSRGQQKILVLTLNLALSEMIRDTRGYPPILLVDDLAAELDRGNRQRMLDQFEEGGGQVFLTKIEDSALQSDSSTARTFHVEHGAIK